MKKPHETLTMAAAALLSSCLTGRAATIAPQDCRDADTLRGYLSAQSHEGGARMVAAGTDLSGEEIERLMAEAKAACPSLPWDSIDAIARKIAGEDMAVKLGTTQRYFFSSWADQVRSAAAGAVGACAGSMFLDRCLQELTCAETGSNSCLCMKPAEKARRPLCR